MVASTNQRSSYSDFEIEVGNGFVRAESVLVGEARAEFKNPYNQVERDTLYQWLGQAINASRGTSGVRLSSLRLNEPQYIGQKLFEALFPRPIYSLYEKCRAITIDRSMAGTRLKLRILDDFALLPWELLYDPRDDYLALTPKLVMVRYLDAAVPVRPIGIQGPLRILLVLGSTDGLNLNEEVRRVQAALQRLQNTKQIILDVLPDATLELLYEKTRSTPFHVIHYMGHSTAPTASEPPQLIMADQSVDIDTVWRTLRRADHLRLIWLNSCSSAVGQDGGLAGPMTSAAARFVRSGVPAVIANQLRISNQAATQVAQAFYTNLADGMPVDVALAEARVKVSVLALQSLEWATPVLFMRAPDGILFQKDQLIQPPPANNTDTVTYIAGDNITIGDITSSSGVAIGRGATSNVQSNNPRTTPPEDVGAKQMLQQQLTELRRRLAQRELQRARYGISADPSIIIEIEDLKKEIAELQRQIGLSS